jgi:hypothetical protein
MGKFDWVRFEGGKARFCGSARGGDDKGHDVVAVQVDGGRVNYGEFDLTYARDHNHYNAEILSFGYATEGNVSNPHAVDRASFPPAEIELIKSMISGLILRDDEKPFPLNDWREYFLGAVLFREGWILQE